MRNGNSKSKNFNGQQNSNQAAFIYNGTGFGGMNSTNAQAGPSHMSGMLDSDGEQSDFKTTTLRFTNNNFINAASNTKERDSSLGAGVNSNTQYQ